MLFVFRLSPCLVGAVGWPPSFFPLSLLLRLRSGGSSCYPRFWLIAFCRPRVAFSRSLFSPGRLARALVLSPASRCSGPHAWLIATPWSSDPSFDRPLRSNFLASASCFWCPLRALTAAVHFFCPFLPLRNLCLASPVFVVPPRSPLPVLACPVVGPPWLRRPAAGFSSFGFCSPSLLPGCFCRQRTFRSRSLLVLLCFGSSCRFRRR